MNCDAADVHSHAMSPRETEVNDGDGDDVTRQGSLENTWPVGWHLTSRSSREQAIEMNLEALITGRWWLSITRQVRHARSEPRLQPATKLANSLMPWSQASLYLSLHPIDQSRNIQRAHWIIFPARVLTPQPSVT